MAQTVERLGVPHGDSPHAHSRPRSRSARNARQPEPLFHSADHSSRQPATPRRLSTALTANPPGAEAIDAATRVLQAGDFLRYCGETDASGIGRASAQFEAAFAGHLGAPFAVAVNSGACAIFLALKAAGVGHGDAVLLNSWTLSCVAGAVEHVGARTILVDTDPRTLTVSVPDLERKIAQHGPKAFVMSHMRGRLGDLQAVADLCKAAACALIEDCAHALGGEFNGRQAGTFGDAGCFSLNAYKQINAGELGAVVTSSEDLAARVVLLSGSYMFYGEHGAAPPPDSPVWGRWKGRTPNYSMRASELAAALALPQLKLLKGRNQRWKHLHDTIAEGLRVIPGVRVPEHVAGSRWTPTHVQFWIDEAGPAIRSLLGHAAERGINVKWYGATEAVGVTSNFHHWGWVDAEDEQLPGISQAIQTLCEVRLPYTLTDADCDIIADAVAAAVAAVRGGR